jgi:hypothetical protein
MSDTRLPSKHWDHRVYAGLLGAVFQSFVEANVKRGLQFYIEEEITLTANQTKSWLITTGDKPLIIKYYSASADSGLRLTLRENPVISSEGTDSNTLIRNYNRKEPIPTTCEFFQDPVITTDGERFGLIRVHTATNQQNMGSSPTNNQGIEVILPKNTTIQINFQNMVNNSNLIVFWMTWYEGDTSDNMN